MKKFLLSGAALLALAATLTPAQAQLSIKQKRSGIPAGGGQAGLQGTLENDGAQSLTITRYDLEDPGNFFFNINEDILGNALPLTLAPGDSYDGEPYTYEGDASTTADDIFYPNTLLVLNMSDSPASQYADIAFFGTLGDSTNETFLGRERFFFGPDASAVPEPGAMALLGGSLIGGGLLLRRRASR